MMALQHMLIVGSLLHKEVTWEILPEERRRQSSDLKEIHTQLISQITCADVVTMACSRSVRAAKGNGLK